MWLWTKKTSDQIGLSSMEVIFVDWDHLSDVFLYFVYLFEAFSGRSNKKSPMWVCWHCHTTSKVWQAWRQNIKKWIRAVEKKYKLILWRKKEKIEGKRDSNPRPSYLRWWAWWCDWWAEWSRSDTRTCRRPGGSWVWSSAASLPSRACEWPWSEGRTCRSACRWSGGACRRVEAMIPERGPASIRTRPQLSVHWSCKPLCTRSRIWALLRIKYRRILKSTNAIQIIFINN